MTARFDQDKIFGWGAGLGNRLAIAIKMKSYSSDSAYLASGVYYLVSYGWKCWFEWANFLCDISLFSDSYLAKNGSLVSVDPVRMRLKKHAFMIEVVE